MEIARLLRKLHGGRGRNGSDLECDLGHKNGTTTVLLPFLMLVPWLGSGIIEAQIKEN